jgi:hypothetical protein
MSKRRYRLKRFLEMMGTADFDVVFSTSFTSFGAPLILGSKAVNALTRKTSTTRHAPMNPMLNATFYGLARMEACLVQASIPMPFGTTILCVGRRR